MKLTSFAAHFLFVRSLQLAFGSLVTTETVDLLRTGSGEVALGETPLSPGTEYNLDSSPPVRQRYY